MNNIMVKVRKLTVVILAILLLFSIKTMAVAATVKSLIAPTEASLLGTGFNSISKSFVSDNKCLNYSNNVETATQGTMNNLSAYFFVNSKKELEDKFIYNFATNSEETPDSTAISRVTDMIINNTNFSADKITIVAYWKQEDNKMYSNEVPTINNEGLSILKADPKQFVRQYGDKYISSVTLGKIFYIIYQADISKYSTYSTRTKNAIRRAMEFNLKRMQGAKLSADESSLVADKLEGVSISSRTYGNDIADQDGPYNADDYKNILKKMNQTDSQVISCELKDYSNAYNKTEEAFYDISDYLNMAEQWRNHLASLNYIVSNTRIGLDLNTDCMTEINNINTQLKLVDTVDSQARLPSGKETLKFDSLYYRYINEMQIIPRTYIMPPARNKFDINLSSINDVESIKIQCSVDTKKKGYGGFFGGFSNKPFLLLLYVMDEDGNSSEIQSIPMNKADTVTLYEGVKISDKYQIRFSDARIKPSDIQIFCSFTEKVDDIIWIYLHNRAAKGSNNGVRDQPGNMGPRSF
ncbi:MAG TPA: hypothetical protein DDW65_11695 [Firmicutes bacterium]|jgi:hypothetical protein|nr:hypothetical protein [Bacillota bacterium]